MKLRNNKYLLGFSFLACLAIGIVFGKYIIPRVYSPDSSYAVSSSNMVGSGNIYVGGGIPVYAQEASPIIIGEVKGISDPVDNSWPTSVPRLFLQHVNVDVNEVLKGNAALKSVNVRVDVVQTADGRFVPEVSFKPGEKVLLFLSEDSLGNYGIFGGPYGKYLIDTNDDVTSLEEAKMPLADAKTKISEAMKAPPILQHSPPVPYSGEANPTQG